MMPLCLSQRAELCRYLAYMVLQIVERLEMRIGSHITADPFEESLRNKRADVVDDKFADRRLRLCGEQHADNTAHRGANPVERACTITVPQKATKSRKPVARGRPQRDVRKQHCYVGQILWNSVIFFVG